MKKQDNNPCRLVIFHSPLQADAPADELDVLEQVVFFRQGLEALGYEVLVSPFDYDLKQLEAWLKKNQPQFAVNLTETLFGSGRLVHLAPALLEHFQIPFTGCSSDAIYLSSHKIIAKRWMMAHGIPTPSFTDAANAGRMLPSGAQTEYIIKSVWEHASYGLDEKQKLIFSGQDDLMKGFMSKDDPASYFAEEYIHGREFNVSVLDPGTGPRVLPLAEIVFDYPESMPRIVGYRAKWDQDSFEYKNTRRVFLDESQEPELQQSIRELCLRCWDAFGLKAYARVDFRIDSNGRPLVLEINANPCISPDAGFVAAATQAGLNRQQLLSGIISHCLKK